MQSKGAKTLKNSEKRQNDKNKIEKNGFFNNYIEQRINVGLTLTITLT